MCGNFLTAMLVTLGQGFPVIEAAELNFDLVSTNSWEPLIHSLQNEATISRGVTINWNIEKLYRECLWYAYRYYSYHHGCLNRYKRYLLWWLKLYWKSHRIWLWVQYKYIETSMQKGSKNKDNINSSFQYYKSLVFVFIAKKQINTYSNQSNHKSGLLTLH